MQFSFVAYRVEHGVTKGRVEARTAAEARADLAFRGLKPIRLGPARRLPGIEKLFPSLHKVGASELVRFCRNIAAMLESGGSLLRALEILRDETRSRTMRRTLNAIRQTLDEGGSLSEALVEHPLVFSRLFASVAEVGEYTGRLGPALEQLGDILEKEHEAKRKALRTMMYPLVIVLLAIVTMGVLLQVALPPMLKVFERMGTEIQLVTRIVVAAFSLVRDYFLQIAVGGVVLAVVFALLRRIPVIRYRLDAVQARIPLFGPVIVSAELSRFSRTMALLL